MSIALFVGGPKGANFLRNFRSDTIVKLVVSYPSRGMATRRLWRDPRAFAETNDISFIVRDDVRSENFASVNLVLLIGWQLLSKDLDDASWFFMTPCYLSCAGSIRL